MSRGHRRVDRPSAPCTPSLACRVLGVAALVTAATALPAQTGPTAPPASMTAVRLAPATPAPRLDGRLDDAAWRDATPMDDLRQREPLEGVPATERTIVRVVYDATTLYVAVEAHDAEPEAVVARIRERDRVLSTNFDGSPVFGGDDGIALLIDGMHDHRNAMVFATNPNGAEFDALITDEGREFNIDWRGIWRVVASRTPTGWVAEFALPFRSLRYRGEADTWGFNVYRMVRRKNEEALWQGWTRSGGGFARVSLAGHLTGFAGLPRPRRNVEVRPYLLGGGDETRDEGAWSRTPRQGLGGELKAQVGDGLVLDATVNTDFAQVEADNVQVNLGRFSLFFPEKREFFLENAGVFEFGARELFGPPPFLPFFSRRIGIAEDGPVPVRGGARLTGRVGGQTVGLLSMVTDATAEVPEERFTVARAKRDIGGNNYVGAMLTDRRRDGAANTAGGVDFSLWPTQVVNVQGFVARTATAGPGGEGGAQRIALNAQTGVYGVSLQHLRIGEETDAQLGFITRRNIQQTGGSTRLTWRPGVLGLRTVNWLTFSDYIARIDGGLQDWRVANAIDLTFNSGASVTAYRRLGATRLDDGFDIADRLAVPAGAFDDHVTGAFLSTNPARAVQLGFNAERNTVYGGTLTTASVDLGARVGVNLGLSLNGQRSWVQVPSGALRSDIVSLRAGWAFSTQMFLNALVQYNGLDQALSSNLRFQYIFRPGSDLFLVFNETRGTPLDPWAAQDRGVRVKLAYLRRL